MGKTVDRAAVCCFLDTQLLNGLVARDCRHAHATPCDRSGSAECATRGMEIERRTGGDTDGNDVKRPSRIPNAEVGGSHTGECVREEDVEAA